MVDEAAVHCQPLGEVGEELEVLEESADVVSAADMWVSLESSLAELRSTGIESMQKPCKKKRKAKAKAAGKVEGDEGDATGAAALTNKRMNANMCVQAFMHACT